MTPHLLRRRPGVVRTAALVAVVGGLAVAGGCGSSGASVQSAPASVDTLAPVQSGVVKVAAIDNYFKDADVTVTAGSKVVWTNLGRNDHNVKSSEGTDGITVETSAFPPRGVGHRHVLHAGHLPLLLQHPRHRRQGHGRHRPGRGAVTMPATPRRPPTGESP